MVRLVFGAITVILSAASAWACDLHGEFGFGSFGNMHPLAQKHYGGNQQSITVTHAQNVAIEFDKPQSLSLSYHVPMAFKDAKINVTVSDDVELLNEPEMRLTQSTGEHKLNYLVRQPGNHRITLSITGKGALSTLMQSYKVQQINVTAF